VVRRIDLTQFGAGFNSPAPNYFTKGGQEVRKLMLAIVLAGLAVASSAAVVLAEGHPGCCF